MTGLVHRFAALGFAEFNGLRRDPIALFFIFALPVALVVVLGFAFGGETENTVRVGIVAESGDSVTAELVDGLRAESAVELATYDTAADLRDAILRANQQLGIIVPPDFGPRVEAGQAATLDVITSASAPQGIAEAAIAPVVTRRLLVADAAHVAADTTGADVAAAEQAANAVVRNTDLGGVTTRVAGGDTEPISGFQYTSYTMLVLFMLITAFSSAGTIVELRDFGIARRMLVTPAPSGQLVIGVVIARWTTLVAGGLFLVLATRLIFDVRWGRIPATLVVVFVLGICMASLMALAGTFFRTQEQAAAIGVPIGIGLGMLSGTMWPLEIVPRFMQIIGHLIPTAWAVDAFAKIFGEEAGVADVLPEIGIIIGFAVLIFAAASVRLRTTFGTG